MAVKLPGAKLALALVATVVALVLMPSSTSAVSGATADPQEIALSYVDKNAGELGVTDADVADLFVTSNYRSSHSGVTHVNLNQSYRDLEVFGGHVTVNVAADQSVIFAGGSLVRGLGASASGTAGLEATEAVEAAAEALELGEPADLRVLSQSGGPAQETVVSDGGISAEPIPLRLGWQPTGSGLRMAWQLVIDATSGDSLWNATVDAETGKLLDSDDWTSKDTVADLTSTLMRSGGATAGSAGSAESDLVTPDPVNDGSSYRVLELPTESPNDGPRTLVTNPADATASPFGWHDTNGAAGPEFTTTQGNNAHAYLDQDNNNSMDFGGSPNGGPGLTFDFPADLSGHAQNYRDAVVANLFYTNNAFHDIMHGFGFDEPSGNFQANNYGRGGGGTDYVRAEAADGGGTNNANFSTPAADSGTPRMQMYLWPGNQFGSQNQVVVDAVGSFNASWSRFGPSPTNAGLPGRTIVYAGTGCNAALYPAPPASDWMAIVDGGTVACSYLQRVQVAESLGADAVIVAHNTTAAAPVLTASMVGPPVGIPAVAVTQADGTTIKDAVAAGPTTGSVRKHPDHPGIRDGDFENGIIIHEYGHGISNRLTGGPGINCLSGNEQAGEGWSDYYAISMLLDPELDDPNLGRGMGPYALFQADRHGAGIRPRPYSRNMEIQPFTYDSIKTGGWLNGTSLALPHGLGHGWAAVLWDLNWDLIDKYGFNPDLYGDWDTGGNNRAIQYVTDGLKLQGCGPGLVVARAAIVAAATELTDGADTCTVWATFARRGLGFSAVQNTTNRDDNSEAFDTHPECQEGFFGGVSDEPSLNTVKPGSTQPLVFSIGGNQGLDILASDSPYSRLVDCTTLKTVGPGPFITPRPIPVPAQTPGNSGLAYDPTQDRYTYPWQTLQEWDGTCREFVLTRKDGVQHRAYFRFSKAPSFPVSGHVRDSDAQAVANATVSLTGTQSPLTTTTDADGFYSFASVLKGDYSATAAGGGCVASQTKTVSVSKPTTLDFTLPSKADSFGYTCQLEDAAFTEAANVLALTGDDASATVSLPFTFTFYGQQYNTAFVSTNGNLNFLASSTAFTNASIPATGTPNAAIYSFWDDVVVDASASVRTQLLGAAPNRRFVVEWRNVHIVSDTTRRVNVNIVLHENGQIVTQARSIADDGRERGNSATLGIENATGTVALLYSFNQAVLGVDPAVTSIRYLPPA